MIQVEDQFYEVLQDKRDGWNPEAFKERYSEVLAKYDYIVGDWGYSQLRLRGFYDDSNKKAKASYDNKISTLDEYIHEYCNFGCAYFVLKKIDPPAGRIMEQQAYEQEESSVPEESSESLA